MMGWLPIKIDGASSIFTNNRSFNNLDTLHLRTSYTRDDMANNIY